MISFFIIILDTFIVHATCRYWLIYNFIVISRYKYAKKLIKKCFISNFKLGLFHFLPIKNYECIKLIIFIIYSNKNNYLVDLRHVQFKKVAR